MPQTPDAKDMIADFEDSFIYYDTMAIYYHYGVMKPLVAAPLPASARAFI